MATLPWLEEPVEKQVQRLRQDVADLEDQIADILQRFPRNAQVDLAQGHVHTNVTTPAALMIATASQLSVGIELSAYGAAAPTSAGWPTASGAIFVPFYLPETVIFRRLHWLNGAAISGNVDMGIYSIDDLGASVLALTRVVSTGSVAQAGINGLQSFDITDTTLGPGRFYFALAINNVTATVFRWTLATAEFVKLIHLFRRATHFPLPATTTVATDETNYIPVMGASLAQDDF